MTLRPLIGFFVAGALLFAGRRYIGGPAAGEDGAPRPLVVLVAQDATDAEVERAIDEAVLVRAALDRGGAFVDPVVRDRLRVAAQVDGPAGVAPLAPELAAELATADPVVRQRLLFQAESLLAAGRSAEPSPEELTAYLAAHAARYRRAARVTIDHVFIAPARHPEGADAVAAARLAALDVSPAARVTSDPTLLPTRLASATEREVGSRFGAVVASAAFTATGDRWFGPIRSAFGLHLLRVSAREGGHDATLPEVRARVVSDYVHDRRGADLAAAARTFRHRYRIDVRRSLP